MIDVVNSLRNYLFENWPELVWLVVAAAVASYLAGRRSRNAWLQRSFLDRLNISLTSVNDDTLRIRTIAELDVDEVFLNRSASARLIKLARQTTPDDPLIAIPRDDCWYYLNAVLNEISERFADGHLRRDVGIPTTTATYLVCLTCERAGSVRTHKIRAMMVKKSLLIELPETQPALEDESHITRWQTLQILAQRYSIAPHYFLQLELYL